MAKRGRKPKVGIVRAAAPTLAMRSVKAGRRSDASGRMPVHFKHISFKRDRREKTALRKHQHYIERDGAAEPAPTNQPLDPALVQGAAKFIEIEAVQTDGKASFGTLGETPKERRDFWSAVDLIEGPRARLQYGVIAELPHEATPTGRLAIVKDFCRTEFEQRHLSRGDQGDKARRSG